MADHPLPLVCCHSHTPWLSSTELFGKELPSTVWLRMIHVPSGTCAARPTQTHTHTLMATMHAHKHGQTDRHVLHVTQTHYAAADIIHKKKQKGESSFPFVAMVMRLVKVPNMHTVSCYCQPRTWSAVSTWTVQIICHIQLKWLACNTGTSIKNVCTSIHCELSDRRRPAVSIIIKLSENTNRKLLEMQLAGSGLG